MSERTAVSKTGIPACLRERSAPGKTGTDFPFIIFQNFSIVIQMPGLSEPGAVATGRMLKQEL